MCYLLLKFTDQISPLNSVIKVSFHFSNFCKYIENTLRIANLSNIE